MQTSHSPTMFEIAVKWLINFLADKGTLLTALVFAINMAVKNMVVYLAVCLNWFNVENAETMLKLGAGVFAFLSAGCLFLYHVLRLYKEFHKPNEE